MTLVTQPQKDKEANQMPELVQPQSPISQQVMGVELINKRSKDMDRAVLVEDVEDVQIDDSDPSWKTQIGMKLSSKERQELITFLRANKYVFAWTSVDMPGIPTSIAMHRLSTNPLRKPVV